MKGCYERGAEGRETFSKSHGWEPRKFENGVGAFGSRKGGTDIGGQE